MLCHFARLTFMRMTRSCQIDGHFANKPEEGDTIHKSSTSFPFVACRRIYDFESTSFHAIESLISRCQFLCDCIIHCKLILAALQQLGVSFTSTSQVNLQLNSSSLNKLYIDRRTADI